MRRAELEHIIRACSTIAEDDDIIIIGSQSVLGQFPEAPDELLVSNEADVYPRNHPERAELIRHGLVDRAELERRLAQTELIPELRVRIEGLMARDFDELASGP